MFPRAWITLSLTDSFYKENILINDTGHACLADFGLLTIATDVTCSNTFLEGGSYRWMSPELFFPKEFGLKDPRPTESSDCYAFGMVIYEVLSGKKPFYGCEGYDIVVKIHRGERPVRPRGAEGRWFTNDIWNILEGCWERSPGDRLRVESILCCFEVSAFLTPPQMVAQPPVLVQILDDFIQQTRDHAIFFFFPDAVNISFRGRVDMSHPFTLLKLVLP